MHRFPSPLPIRQTFQRIFTHIRSTYRIHSSISSSFYSSRPFPHRFSSRSASSSSTPFRSFTMSSTAAATSFHQLSAQDSKKNNVDFKQYEGKVVLVVNVASKCGFTKQYAGLEKLNEDYASKGLVILGFPCNQFGGQEPGTEEEIESFCSLTYGVKFPIMSKIEVNGEKEHPVYNWLKSQKSQLGMKRIKWNFEKFLINKQGQVVDRWSSITEPTTIAKAIEEELAKN